MEKKGKEFPREVSKLGCHCCGEAQGPKLVGEVRFYLAYIYPPHSPHELSQTGTQKAQEPGGRS